MNDTKPDIAEQYSSAVMGDATMIRPVTGGYYYFCTIRNRNGWRQVGADTYLVVDDFGAMKCGTPLHPVVDDWGSLVNAGCAI